ncbi:MAG: hypothetical protein ABI577_19310 [bacterium]
MKSSLFALAIAVAAAAGACSDGERTRPTPTYEPNATNAAPIYTVTPAPTVLAPASDPVIKTYARGETVDVPRGTLFLDPKTGGGEAWADVAVSPLGLFAVWNGGDGKQPPVLFETLTRRRTELDTGGQFGDVLNFSPDETEVAVRVGAEVRIASTADGRVRVVLPVPVGTTSAQAFWATGGGVAVIAAGPQGHQSLGVVAWWRGQLKTYSSVLASGWLDWSPDGDRFVAFTATEPPTTVVVDLRTDAVTRIDQPLYNPKWSASGGYFEGQLLSGEVLVFRADGTPHMRMNGVCALVGSPWLGDEIATFGFGQDVAVAMDGVVRGYTAAPTNAHVTTFGPGNGVVLLDRIGGLPLAELKVAESILVSGYLGFPWVTPDGRGKLQLGVGGRGACENVGAFKVELAPFD